MNKYSFTEWEIDGSLFIKEIYLNEDGGWAEPIVIIRLYDDKVEFLPIPYDYYSRPHHFHNLFYKTYKPTYNIEGNMKLVDEFLSKLELIEVFG